MSVVAAISVGIGICLVLCILAKTGTVCLKCEFNLPKQDDDISESDIESGDGEIGAGEKIQEEDLMVTKQLLNYVPKSCMKSSADKEIPDVDYPHDTDAAKPGKDIKRITFDNRVDVIAEPPLYK